MGADVSRLGAVIGAFKIGDTNVKLPGSAFDRMGNFADQRGWHRDSCQLFAGGQSGPDPFTGYVQRYGRDNPVRIAGVDQIALKVVYAVHAKRFKPHAAQLAADGALLLDNRQLIGGIGFAKGAGRLLSKLPATDDPKVLHR